MGISKNSNVTQSRTEEEIIDWKIKQCQDIVDIFEEENKSYTTKSNMFINLDDISDNN